MVQILKGLIMVAILTGCATKHYEIKEGVWRGVVQLQGQELAFNFAIQKDSTGSYRAFVKNGQENLVLNEVSMEDDSLVMVMHIFDSELKAKIEGDSLKGYFIKNYEKNYRIPFRAAYNQNFRFSPDDALPGHSFAGKYAVTFINESDTTPAIGIIEHKAGSIVEGTFLTPTGDYRFLEGNVINNKIYLSTFDGNHAYLFTATKTSDSTLSGEYWSGKTWYQTWTAVQDDGASLPDAGTLTYLKEGYDKIEFSFPGVDRNMVSPSDEKYKNKVLILQIFGTWCPNCMDETKFLASWYKENKEKGVEIIGLAYESKADFDYASSRVKKMIDNLGVEYDFVIAGTRSKEEASKTLPMLNRVVAFPTTIFIGRDGKVKKIHTGFSGPGTGAYYQQHILHFNETVNELLRENIALEFRH